jgi:hypothetical protein
MEHSEFSHLPMDGEFVLSYQRTQLAWPLAVYIDGKKRDVIRPGETLFYSLKAGKHSVGVGKHMGLATTRVAVAADGTTKVVCGVNNFTNTFHTIRYAAFVAVWFALWSWQDFAMHRAHLGPIGQLGALFGIGAVTVVCSVASAFQLANPIWCKDQHAEA